MTVTLDPLTHVYRTDDGREMPSVTRILEAIGVREIYRGDPIYGTRGTWVHRATELVDAGDLDWERAEADQPEWIGYVRAYERFRAENVIEILGTEEIVWSETMWYAGMCDRRVKRGKLLVRLDFKTGEPSRSDIVQLAGYDATAERHDLRPVYLRKDGSYRAGPVSEAEQETARHVWHAAITLYNWSNRR